MGTIYLDVLVKRLPADAQGEVLQFLVDTGAVYTLASGDVLKRLGIVPHRVLKLTLADGSKTKHQMGRAILNIKGPAASRRSFLVWRAI